MNFYINKSAKKDIEKSMMLLNYESESALISDAVKFFTKQKRKQSLLELGRINAEYYQKNPEELKIMMQIQGIEKISTIEPEWHILKLNPLSC